MKSTYLFSLLFLIIEVKAQKPLDWAFNLNLNSLKAEYQEPKNFEPLDSIRSTFCMSDRKELFQYSLINDQGDIAIRFSTIRIIHWKNGDVEMIKKMFNVSDVAPPNKNYLRTIYLQLNEDTVSRIFYYPQKYAKKKFRADVAGEYDRQCVTVYKEKFYKCRVVFLHKEDVGDCFIHYFYEDDKRKKAEKIIKKTAGMFRFL